MRPTGRAVFLFALGVPLSLLLNLVDETLWLVGIGYLGAVLLLLGADLVLGLPRRAFSIAVEPPNALFIGEIDPLGIDLRMTGTGRRTRFELVCDVGGDLDRPLPQDGELDAGEDLRFEVPLVPLRRGHVSVDRLWLRWTGPLGMMWRVAIHPVGAAIPVLPNIRAVRQAALRLSFRDSYFGMKPEHQQGEGSDFDALRDYMPGLDHRSIDWKHSARHNKLVCKEFRTERNHQIVLAFDTGYLMSEPLDGIPKLDRAINAGLMLAYASLRGGDRVGLYGFDSRVRRYTEPVGGTSAFGLLQRFSAEFGYRAEETNFTLGLAELTARLTRRSLVVLLTDFVDTVTAELMVENLGRLSRRHLVLFVTLSDTGLVAARSRSPSDMMDVARAVVADDFLRERAMVFDRLRRLGVLCLEAPSATINADLLNRYIQIKRQELI